MVFTVLVCAGGDRDRSLIRHFCRSLGWQAVFAGPDAAGLPADSDCHAAIFLPVDAGHAGELVEAFGARLRSHPLRRRAIIVLPAGTPRDTVERAKAVFPLVETQPLFLSTFRIAVETLAGRKTG